MREKLRYLLFLYFLIPIIAKAQCDASFTTSTDCNCVTFTPNVIDSTCIYTWNFGLGNEVSNEITPVYCYTFTGNDTSSVTVNLNIDCGGIGIPCDSSIVVDVLQVPDAGLNPVNAPGWLNCTAVLGQTFTLAVQNTSSTISTNNLYIINWGDSTMVGNQMLPNIDTFPSTFTSALHNYIDLQSYNISITAVGENGCSSTTNYEFINSSATPDIGLELDGITNECIGYTGQFIISNTEENPPFTKYVVQIDNGTGDSLIFSHPPPDTFFYTFYTGSCFDTTIISGIVYPHSFSVAITAMIDSCGAATAAVGPIRIDEPPLAAFTTEPDVTQCALADTFHLINESIPGNYNLIGTNQCSDSTYYYWTVSPNANYTLTQGSLGLYNDIPGLATPGSVDGISLVFNTPGTYTLSLIAQSVLGSICDTSMATQTICVLPQPVADYMSSISLDCAPSIIEFTNLSNTLGACEAAQYNWSVDFLESACGLDSSYQFVGNNMISPTIQFNSSGQYLVGLQVINRCDTAYYEELITIAKTSVVEINPIEDACLGLEISPSFENITDCYAPASCIWYFPNPNDPSLIDTVIGCDPEAISYNRIGTYTITVEVFNECGTTTDTETFTVYDLPPLPTINTNSPVCTEDDLCLSVTNLQMHQIISWQGPQGWTSTLLSDCIENASQNDAGNYQLTVTDTLTGCSNSTTINLGVLPLPVVDVTPNDPEICFGDSLTINLNGLNSTYLFSPPTGLNTTTGATVIAAPLQTTTYSITILDTLTGCASVDTITLVVHPLPIVDAGPDTISCSGSNLSLAGSPMGGVWSDEQGDNLANGLFNESTPGNYTLYYDYTDANGCHDRDSLEVCVLSNPISSFSVDNLMGCEGAVLQATNTSNTLNDCQSTQYTWSVLFNGAACHTDSMAWSFQSGGANSIDASFLFERSGLYTIILETTNACDTVRTSENIRIGAAPAVMIDSLAILCEQFTVQPSASVSLCNSLQATYSWSFPGADVTSFDGLQAPMLTYSSTGVYTISLTVLTECGESTADYSFEIYDLPSVSASNDGPSCAGGNITLTANAPSAESYEWEGPDGFSSVLPNPVLDNISSLQQGTYSVTVTDANGCENSASTLVAVLPLPDVEIIASTPSICFGDTLSLVAMGDNSYIYTWSPATGLNTTQGNMVFASPDTTTTYFLASLNTLTGCASVDTLTVIVYPLPIVDAGPDAISCSGINLPLAGSPMGGIWSDEEGDNLTNGLFNESTPGNYTLYYDYTDANGCSDRDSLEVCVLSNPISSFSVDNLMGCEGAVIQATNTSNTLNDCQSTQYTWSVLFNGAACHSDSMAWSFQSGGANSIDASFLFEKSGLYTIILETANACDTVRTSENIRIGATPAVLIDSLAVLCEQFTIQPSASVSLCNSLQASYSWSFPGADLTSFDGLQAPMLTYSSTGVYTISLTVQTECGESTADYSFEIYDLPSVSASNDGPSCAGGNIALTANAPTAIAYEWEGPGGFSSVSPNPVLTNISPLQQGNYSVTVTDANGCENSASTLVAVLPLPDVAVIASAPSICLGDTMTLSAISDSLYNYTWSPSTDINTTQGSVVSVYPAVTTTYYLASLNTMTGCSSMDSFRVVVNPLPIVEAGDGYLSCIGEPLSLEGIPAGGIWSDNLGNEIVDGLSTQTMAGVYDVYYEFTTTEGCTEVDSTQICVLEDPLANFDADATMGCFPLTVNCSNTSNTLASCTPADYRWTIRREEDSCDPGSMGWSFISGNTNATNISLLFTSPGIYLVELEVSNLCGSQVFSRTITVGGAPSAELFEFPNQCDNYEINPELVSLLSCNNPLTAIEWSFGPDASIDSWTGEEPPQISFGTTGIKTVEVAVSNECGTSIRTIDFEIFDLPDLTAGSDTTVCLGDTIQLTANSSISNISFEWTGPNNYSAPNSNPIIVNPQLMDAGPYIVEVADLNTGCTNKDTTILMINPLPLVEAGPDESLCAEDSPIQLAGSPAGPNGEWGGAIVNEQGEINPALHLAGTYPITYFYTDDQTLCSAADSLSVTIHPLALEELYQDTLCEDESLIFNGTLYDIDNTTGTEVYTSEVGCDSLRLAVDLGFRVLEMITTIVKPACIGEDNGAIIVESVLGGQAPYTVFLEETAVALTDTFPFQIPRLSAGTYDLMVEDLNGCQVFEDNILVQDPDEIRLNLGEDQTITLGDSVRLIAQLIPPVGSNPTIDWEPNDSSLIIVDNMSATPFAKPFRTRRYTATYTDERGCSVTDDIVITVDRTPNVFIPNVFSPNGDGNNEVFFINAGIDIAEVEVFNIFNRWGANIFEGRNFQPNDPAHGWDGTFKGEELDPAVFVYFAKLRQVDGEIIIFKGDVTLIR